MRRADHELMTLAAANDPAIADPRPAGPCRLSEIPVGHRVTVEFAETLLAERRMVLYGLIDGIEVGVEKRGASGDLIVRFAEARYHIPANLARTIWVTPCTAG